MGGMWSKQRGIAATARPMRKMLSGLFLSRQKDRAGGKSELVLLYRKG